MRKLFLTLLLLAALLSPSFGKGAEDDAIIAATKIYVAANSGLTTITAAVEQVEGDFARVKVTPEDKKATDPAWVFLKKADGKWTGLTLGTSFTTEDYQQLGMPNALRVP